MNRLADFVVNHRIKVAIITLLMAFTVFAGIPNLRLDTDGRVFMANDNPDKILLDKFEQEVAKDDTHSMPSRGEYAGDLTGKSANWFRFQDADRKSRDKASSKKVVKQGGAEPVKGTPWA